MLKMFVLVHRENLRIQSVSGVLVESLMHQVASRRQRGRQNMFLSIRGTARMSLSLRGVLGNRVNAFQMRIWYTIGMMCQRRSRIRMMTGSPRNRRVLVNELHVDSSPSAVHQRSFGLGSSGDYGYAGILRIVRGSDRGGVAVPRRHDVNLMGILAGDSGATNWS